MKLIDEIMFLRTMAVGTYEKCKREGIPPEQMNVHMKPFADQMEALITRAVRDHVPEAVQTMEILEGFAKIHEKEAQRMIEKADDLRVFLKTFANKFADRMKSEGVRSLRNGDHVVVLNQVNGEDFVSYR